MLSFGKRLIDSAPVLHVPAHKAFKAALWMKNAVLFPLYRDFGILPGSLSDRGQDRWVIETLGGKRDGFFLDMGAADGFSESNTFILENRYGWKGICIEPTPTQFDLLTKVYKRRCICVSDVVDGQEGEVDFVVSGQESGLVGSDTDNKRSEGTVIRRKAKTLDTVLDECDAPPIIDYFSFDVEGAETRIMREFPFERYKFLTMTIERPTPELNRLLFANGYHFVKNSLYDTFYVHESIHGFAEIKKEPFEQIPPKPL